MAKPTFAACRFYASYTAEEIDTLAAAGYRRMRPGTCSGCGGDDRTGPSCNCPVFGEQDDDDG